MSQLPDLALDSLLYTQFDGGITTHFYPEIDGAGRRSFRTEEWKYERLLGKRGQVQLERCITMGQKQGRPRVVRKIKTQSRSQGTLDFGRELEAIAKFSNSRYKRWFVKSFGWFENSGSISVTMEYCNHGDLQYYLSTRSSLPLAETQQLTFQILEGLHQMHENDFAHTSLKPRNILIKSMPPNEDWWIVLADFGISKCVDPQDESFNTDGFMAPELLGINNQDAPKHISDYKAIDMWALGEIIVRMLSGEATFRNQLELVEYCSGAPFPFDRLLPSVSSDGKDFIKNLMAVYPKDRSSTSQCLKHQWMRLQSRDLTDELAGLHMEQRLPFGWDDSDLLPSVSKTGSSKPAFLNIRRKSLTSSIWSQNGSVEAKERRGWQRSPSVAEEKQLYLSPQVQGEEKQVWNPSTTLAEEKQVDLGPDAKGEEKQVLQRSSTSESPQMMENPRMVEKSLFVANVALHKLKGHLLPVNAVAFSPYSDKLVSASDDGTIKLWDSHSGTTLQTLKSTGHAVNAVAFSPNGKTIVSASAIIDGTINAWDSSSGAQLQTMKCSTKAVNVLAFSPDGSTLASASLLDEGDIKLWNSESGARMKTLFGHCLTVNTLKFSPDGKTIASASYDGYVKLWDAQSGMKLKSLWGYSQWVNALALEPSGIRSKSLVTGGIRDIDYSPDGKILVSATDDGTIRMWDSRSGTALKSFKRQWRWSTVSPVGINSVTFSPGGMTLASGADDGTIRLWDMRTGTDLQTYKAHSKWISAVVFSPNGKMLASTSHDGTIKLWGNYTGNTPLS